MSAKYCLPVPVFYFWTKLTTLQCGLSAIAELLVFVTLRHLCCARKRVLFRPPCVGMSVCVSVPNFITIGRVTYYTWWNTSVCCFIHNVCYSMHELQASTWSGVFFRPPCITTIHRAGKRLTDLDWRLSRRRMRMTVYSNSGLNASIGLIRYVIHDKWAYYEYCLLLPAV